MARIVHPVQLSRGFPRERCRATRVELLPTLPRLPHRVRLPQRWLCGWLAVLLVSLPAWACRYNVRDLGFMDLESEGYQLLLNLGTNMPPAVEAASRLRVEEALRDTNVRLAPVPASSTGAASGASAALATNPPPAAVLVSPDGQTLALPQTGTGDQFVGNLAVAVQELVQSPLRDELLRATSRQFGVILLLEGTDPALNAAARQAAEAAIAEVRQSLARLPKRIADAPALVTLAPTAFTRERVVLWSLRLTTEPTAGPRGAVIYGKARWIGPLMKGAELSAVNLARLFSIIGADCECGMDLAWTRGTSLPIRWGAAVHQAAVSTLGFDPQDPLVQTEAGRILDRYSTSRDASPRSTEAPAATRGDPTLGGAQTGTNVNGVPGVPVPVASIARPIDRPAWRSLGTVLVVIGAATLGLCFVLLRRLRNR